MIRRPDIEQVAAFYECALVEPRLIELEVEVARYRLSEDHPDYWRTYETWKRKLQTLAGEYSDNEGLRDTKHYDTCHRRLLALYEGRA